jgi:hypothetical protein
VFDELLAHCDCLAIDVGGTAAVIEAKDGTVTRAIFLIGDKQFSAPRLPRGAGPLRE